MVAFFSLTDARAARLRDIAIAHYLSYHLRKSLFRFREPESSKVTPCLTQITAQKSSTFYNLGTPRRLQHHLHHFLTQTQLPTSPSPPPPPSLSYSVFHHSVP